MIKVKANESNEIFLNLVPDSVDVNSNSFLMVLDNQQTRKEQSAIITKTADPVYINSRSVKCDIDSISLEFNGSISYCDLDNLVGLLANQTAFTIAFTARSNADEGEDNWENVIFAENNESTGAEFKVGIAPSSGGIWLGSSSQNEYLGSGYNDDLWHRIVVTREEGASAKPKVYVDGVFIGTSFYNYNPVWTSTEKITLGSEWDYGTNNDYFTGYLKNFQLWDVELEAEDVTWDFYNQGSVAWKNSGTTVATKGSLKAHFKLNEGTLKVINNSYYSNLIDHPSDFREWTTTLCNIKYNVAKDSNGFENRASLLTIEEFGVEQPSIQILSRAIPETGTWKFGMWVRGVGKTTSKRGRLTVNLDTADGLVTAHTFAYNTNKEWQWLESGTIIATQVGTVTLDFEPVISGTNSTIEVGDQVYIYGAQLYSTTYDLNGTVFTGSGHDAPVNALWETGFSPMFELQDNTFYNYEVYEQTSSTNTDKYDDSVLGLRESGKLFVSGKSEVTYQKQEEADTTNEVYLKV